VYVTVANAVMVVSINVGAFEMVISFPNSAAAIVVFELTNDENTIGLPLMVVTMSYSTISIMEQVVCRRHRIPGIHPAMVTGTRNTRKPFIFLTHRKILM
jgi:hypothetical protein